MHAAKLGRTEAAKALLAGGANPDIKNDDGQTAADLAVAYGHPEIATLIGISSSQNSSG